jgi:hypothetical protein
MELTPRPQPHVQIYSYIATEYNGDSCAAFVGPIGRPALTLSAPENTVLWLSFIEYNVRCEVYEAAVFEGRRDAAVKAAAAASASQNRPVFWLRERPVSLAPIVLFAH